MKIGLEIHVSLPTKSKLFCSCSNSATEPNSAICEVCMGLPGSKPVLNKGALAIAKRVAEALNMKINERTSFVRKVYFYPDLPKSYQITQLDEPIGTNGHLDIDGKQIHIRRIQLEEDPAKLVRGDDYTLIDFNRSGKPLVEIITEPDIASEDELRSFIAELRSILYYCDIEINEEMKTDLNISGIDSENGERVEVKNITGIAGLTGALRYEITRQSELARKGTRVERETRSYNEAEMRTVAMRKKESDEEYGLIYDADLTEYDLSKVKIEKPIIASRVAHEYASKYGFDPKILLELIMLSKESLLLIDASKGKYPAQAITAGIEYLKKYDKINISRDSFNSLLNIVEKKGMVNKETIEKIEKGEKVESYSGISDEELERTIESMINEKSILLNEYEKNKKVFNFIVGRVAKEKNLDPHYVSEKLNKVLSEKFGLV